MAHKLTAEEIAANNLTGEVIDEFNRKMRALYFLAETQLPHARENQKKGMSSLAEMLAETAATLAKPEANVKQRAHAVNFINEAVGQLKNHAMVKHDEMLAQTIFISIFSIFDAFLNHLLRNLYARKPSLIHMLENRQIVLADLLNNTREQIVESLIDDDIESLLRKSYSEIFEKLAKRFDVSTLKNYPNWPVFIECSQRRNLVTHCDGVVSNQYLAKCKEEKVTLEHGVALDVKLKVTQEYLLNSIDIVNETGIKLGQILWRAACDKSVALADEHLANLIFEFLKREQWQFVLRMSELSEALGKRSNQHLREARIAKILLINHAQAAKWSGNPKLAMKLLDSVDWTDGAIEFRLAVAVIKEEYDNAATLMRMAGSNAELCPIHGYVGWPIFREFRLTPQFAAAFESIFGVGFADEVKKVSDQSVQDMLPEGDDDASRPHA